MAKIFRRFDNFKDADTFALQIHKAQEVQVVYSAHRPDPDFQPLEGQCYGPWMVEDTEDGFMRSWETKVATYPEQGRIRKMTTAIERLTERDQRK